MKPISTSAAFGLCAFVSILFGFLNFHMVLVPVIYLVGLFWGLPFFHRYVLAKTFKSESVRFLGTTAAFCLWTGILTLIF